MTILRMHGLEGRELWRRQHARNLMDCYALGMESAAAAGTEKERKCLESLTRLMVEGMTAVRGTEDEKAFYKMAAAACGECAAMSGKEKASLFRIYGAIFEDMGGEGGLT